MDRQSPLQRRYDALGPRVAEALKKRHFEAYYCKSAAEALQQILNLIPKDHLVSWGGSETLKEMGVQIRLQQEGYRVIDRDTAKDEAERTELMRQALHCDTFLMSSNAVSEDGQLVNIDGNGNRLAAMIFGPKSVIVAAGMNKVVKSPEDGLRRTRTIAAPAVAQRFEKLRTPCFKTGACEDCLSAESICADMVTTRLCRPAGRIKVILIGEDLGL